MRNKKLSFIKLVGDMRELDNQILDVKREIDVLVELSKKAVLENAHSTQDQEGYAAGYNKLLEKYNHAMEQLATLQKERQQRVDRRKKMQWFSARLEKQDGAVAGFIEELFLGLVETMTVRHDGSIEVLFKNGAAIDC